LKKELTDDPQWVNAVKRASGLEAKMRAFYGFESGGDPRAIANFPSRMKYARQAAAMGGDGAPGDIPVSGGAAGRQDSISGMQPEFRARLAAMMKDAPKGASVFSGYRSPELQAQLFAHSDRSGHMVARPGHSHHGAGDAADLRGDLGWFHKNAAKYGLRFPMPYENWHIQSDPNTRVPAPGSSVASGGHPIKGKLSDFDDFVSGKTAAAVKRREAQIKNLPKAVQESIRRAPLNFNRGDDFGTSPSWKGVSADRTAGMESGVIGGQEKEIDRGLTDAGRLAGMDQGKWRARHPLGTDPGMIHGISGDAYDIAGKHLAEINAIRRKASMPIHTTVKFHHDVPGIRDRGEAQARRSFNAEVRRGRYSSYSSVGVV
jgi:hypothetical protein